MAKKAAFLLAGGLVSIIVLVLAIGEGCELHARQDPLPYAQ